MAPSHLVGWDTNRRVDPFHPDEGTKRTKGDQAKCLHVFTLVLRTCSRMDFGGMKAIQNLYQVFLSA